LHKKNIPFLFNILETTCRHKTASPFTVVNVLEGSFPKIFKVFLTTGIFRHFSGKLPELYFEASTKPYFDPSNFYF